MNNSNSVPLSFEALEDGLSISLSNEILYCINGGAWETLLKGENTEEVNKGSVISFRHAKSILGGGSIGKFSINKKCNVYGACSSIIPKVLGEKFMSSDLFYGLFYGCDTIVDASKLELPTTLADYCFYEMFQGCTSLVNAPLLPATTLANYCYGHMFGGCTSLINAPELPATTLADYCYRHMFYNCTRLTTAPELPATTLASYCYASMFSYCSKLNCIKMLATDISADNCLENWVFGVSRTGTFVKNPAMTSLSTGISGIPSGWTVVNDGEESGSNLITFTIDGTEYQAEEGMTWGEWVESKYNVNGDFCISLDNSITYRGYEYSVGTEEHYVFAPDIIQENYNYLIVG